MPPSSLATVWLLLLAPTSQIWRGTRSVQLVQAHPVQLVEGGAGDKYKLPTAVHDAAQLNHIDELKELLDDPATAKFVNERRGGSGNTPLHNAAMAGHLEAAELLVLVGGRKPGAAGTGAHARWQADPNLANEQKATPLHFAAAAGHAAVFEFLLVRAPHNMDYLPARWTKSPRIVINTRSPSTKWP